MKRSQIACLLIIVSATSNTALAHDAKFHKGKPTEGVVEHVTESGFHLKAASDDYQVTFNEDVHVEFGAKEGNRRDIKDGSHVSVFGTKLPSGELVAKEVVIQTEEKKDE